MRAGRSGTAVTVGYLHEAFLYDGVDEFVASSVDYATEGLDEREHVVVAVLPEKIERLSTALGDRAERVTFIDMAEAGRNPARVIQVWRDIVDAAELRGARVRGIGEPIWDGRTDAEISEAQLHEALLNEAFGADQPLRLRCPYDVSKLAPEVVDTARRTHAVVDDGVTREPSALFSPDVLVGRGFTTPLAAPNAVGETVYYTVDELSALRQIVEDFARRNGARPAGAEALMLAVQEIAANTVRHGGGAGTLRAWVDGDALVCELRDSGRIEESMVGRLRPGPNREDGRGIWLANQLCDLVQIRSDGEGTVVRLHVRLPDTVS
ncbi:MAG: anti-sigma factor RsbA family regulatory protein [Nocardioidaceae bacterium]